MLTGSQRLAKSKVRTVLAKFYGGVLTDAFGELVRSHRKAVEIALCEAGLTQRRRRLPLTMLSITIIGTQSEPYEAPR